MPRDRDHHDREDCRDVRSRSDSAMARGDALDALMRDLDLPRGRERQKVEQFDLRGSESRILSAAGTFRAVPQEDLERVAGRSLRKDVEHLRDLGLLTSQSFVSGRERTHVLSVTEQGRSLLEERNHQPDQNLRQTYYSGIAKQRELGHDSRLFQACRDAADRLLADDCRITRVRLDHELKRDYQLFLQEPNRRCRTSSGRPRRDPSEVSRWAAEHQLPIVDDSVRFPDIRIEYERPDGERRIEDIEVVTPHYRGAHLSGKAAAGFSCYRYGSPTIRGARSSSRGGRGKDPRLAEEMLK